MKALLLDAPGDPERLRVGEVDLPVPGRGELRVRVHAVGLNPADYKLARSGHDVWRYPFVLGLDVAGVVDAVGAEAPGWSIGDRLFYHGDLSRPGGYAEYALVAAHVAARIPEGVTFVQAAALPCAGLTAYQAIVRKLRPRSGGTMLIHGGAGGVGGFAVQLARLAGLEVIATAAADDFEFVAGLGADHLIDYRSGDVAAQVMGLTGGRGVDALVDTVSRASATAGLGLLAFNGAIACVADLPDFSVIKPFARGLSIHEIALGGAHLSGDRIAQEDLARMAGELVNLVLAGRIDPLVSEVLSLDAVPDGLRRLADRRARGKLVAMVE